MSFLIVLFILIGSIFAQDLTVMQAHKTYGLLVATESFAESELSRPNATALCSKNVLALYKSIPFSQITNLCKPEDATRASILASARQIQECAQAGDTVLFLFTGMGVGGDFGEPMLLTYDSAFTSEAMAGTSIRIDELTSVLSKDGVQIIMLLDASLNTKFDLVTDSDPQLMTTAGPIASDVPGKYLSLSYAPSVGVWPQDPDLFGNTLAHALGGAADANSDGTITPGEINRFMVEQINTQTGMPPGVRGEWRSATEPILTLKPEQELAIGFPEPHSWRPMVSPTVKRTAIISGASMLAIGGASFALSWRAQKCLEEVCYQNRDEYDSAVSQRNAFLWVTRGASTLGAIGLGGGLVLQPNSASLSLTARW
ncbi:hypothetical protein KKH24_03220 [Patescibacteria group bacterium]|nr:hypothetical protein [Patescibacteria group bacterium]